MDCGLYAGVHVAGRPGGDEEGHSPQGAASLAARVHLDGHHVANDVLRLHDACFLQTAHHGESVQASISP